MAELVDSKLDAEKEAGCLTCKDNRLLVEKAWQIIANEYYDPHERFSQAAWAKQLLQALQVCLIQLCTSSVHCMMMKPWHFPHKLRARLTVAVHGLFRAAVF